jgi:hypothetical protein
MQAPPSNTLLKFSSLPALGLNDAYMRSFVLFALQRSTSLFAAVPAVVGAELVDSKRVKRQWVFVSVVWRWVSRLLRMAGTLSHTYLCHTC